MPGSRRVATLVALPAIALLIGLGTWQVQRLHWKLNLIATMTSRAAMAPVSLADALAMPAKQRDWRHVRVSGHFLNDDEIALFRSSTKGEPGYELLTPLALDGGGTVLVERGWVPLDLKDPAARPGSEPKGHVTLTGILRPGETPGLFTNNNDPAKGAWYWIDLPAIAKATGLSLPPVVVHADAGPAGTWPRGGQMQFKPPNNHLQYAITWYILAVAATVIYVRLLFVHRQQGRPSA